VHHACIIDTDATFRARIGQITARVQEPDFKQEDRKTGKAKLKILPVFPAS
jgi:hypothetical protein